jgi:hypothetical protein
LQAELIRTQGKDLEKNVFARKKAAELMGIDESQVARMIHKQKVLSSLGAERLMNLTADQMAPEIEKLKNQFKDDKEKQKEIANLIKLSDTRTTSQITNDHLAAIEANTKLDISRKVDIGKSRESIKSGVAGFDPIIKSFDSMIPSIGKLTTYTETITAIKDPLVALATNIPVLGRVITELDTKISKFLKFNLPTAGTAPSSVVDGKDVLIMPDRGPIIRQASNDVIDAFRPNDVISNTLNSSNGSIDYNKLASAIANAMRSVKVEAVVKTDNLYAANKMNNARNFS